VILHLFIIKNVQVVSFLLRCGFVSSASNREARNLTTSFLTSAAANAMYLLSICLDKLTKENEKFHNEELHNVQFLFNIVN
jgi:hypothetical protein